MMFWTKAGGVAPLAASIALAAATGGYEVPVYEPFADGLMFCRVMGGIRCYDLRRPAPR